MPNKSFEVNVKPEILVWARESSGFSVQDAAKRLRASVDLLRKLESGEKKPTLSQLEKFANIYKRPLAAFLLPAPPKEPSLPKDFRTLPPEKKKPLSVKTLLAIRRVRRLQALSSELIKITGREFIKGISNVTLKDNPEQLTVKVREQLGIPLPKQFSWSSENQALDEWRKMVERMGIFVFQVSVSLEEMRGFSLTDGEFPVIVLNARDSYTARIFSLFHEYAHILLNDGGMCNLQEIHLSYEIGEVEIFCNHFAGALLVPEDALLAHKLVQGHKHPGKWEDDTLNQIARDFRVSQEVILRRLLIFQLVRDDFYKKKHEEWEKKTTEKRRGGKQNPPKKCVTQNGVPFVSLVLQSHREDKITFSDVSDFLEVRLKHIPKIEQLVGNTG